METKLYFTLSEFLIDPAQIDLPIHVADKLLKHHIAIINPIREQLGEPIMVSKKSGYRPHRWELGNGRSGTSQHTFGDGHAHPQNWWGAADYTSSKLNELFEHLKKSAYRRICIYPKHRFIHCDHKGVEKLAFMSANGKWQRINR